MTPLVSLRLCAPYWLLFSLLTWYCSDNFFFWDTVQFAGLHGTFFYETNFSNFFLPSEIDSGHPPFFGIYVAFFWKIFDKNLIVSHICMLPFLLGIVWQWQKIGAHLFGNEVVWFLPLVLVQPVFLGQSILVSPDLPLFYFFLLAFDAVLREKKYQLSLAYLGMAMLSMRGMMCVVILTLYQIFNSNYFLHFFTQLFFNFKEKTITSIDKMMWKNLIFPILPSALFATLFLLSHYLHTGWIGYHADSTWNESFERVDSQGFIKNFIVLIWRLLDFGNVIFWCCIGIFLLRPKQPFYLFLAKKYWLLLVISIIVLSPSLLLHKGLMTHRYLLPVYAGLMIFGFDAFLKIRRKQFLNYGLIFFLFLGNFWTYPQPIATGWDATLAHLPYYDLRKKMLQYIDNQRIDIETIGSDFPNLHHSKYIDLNDKNISFSAKNLSENQYVFYSNIFNGFSQKELSELKNNWQVEKRFEKGNVKVVLYKK